MGNGKTSMKLSTTIDIKANHTTVYRIAIGAGGAGVEVMPVTL